MQSKIEVSDDFPVPDKGSGKGKSERTLMGNAIRGLSIGQSIPLVTARDYAISINYRVVASRKDSHLYGRKYTIKKEKLNPEQYRIWRTK